MTLRALLTAVAITFGGAAAHAQPEEVDLLATTTNTVVVSSAYEDDEAQAERLVDGDVGTAWNSRTGDLVGAWFEVHLPSAVRVTRVRLTVGYTRQRARGTDLFTGNHRVSRVRVTRDGQPVGEYALDVANRGFQDLPVTGLGGTYRFEVAALVPGSRTDWREVCISELQVLGRAPEAARGTPLTPHAMTAAAMARHAAGSAFLGAMSDVDRALEAYDESLMLVLQGRESDSRWSRTRQAVFLRAAEALNEVLPERAGALRREAAQSAPLVLGERLRDIDAITAAMRAGAETFPTLSCPARDYPVSAYWMRVVRHADGLASRFDAILSGRHPDAEGLSEADFRRLERDAERAERERERIDDLWMAFERGPMEARGRVLRAPAPRDPDLREDWTALTRAIQADPARCLERWNE